MSDRPSIEKEISDTKKTISHLEKDIQQLRDWISANERAVGGMPESLRRITEDGITRARADLAQRENEMQRLRGTLADHQRLLSVLIDMDSKARDIATLEQEQDKIIMLLERHRAELRQLQLSYEELTRPVTAAPCELVLPEQSAHSARRPAGRICDRLARCADAGRAGDRSDGDRWNFAWREPAACGDAVQRGAMDDRGYGQYEWHLSQ